MSARAITMAMYQNTKPSIMPRCPPPCIHPPPAPKKRQSPISKLPHHVVGHKILMGAF